MEQVTWVSEVGTPPKQPLNVLLQLIYCFAFGGELNQIVHVFLWRLSVAEGLVPATWCSLPLDQQLVM